MKKGVTLTTKMPQKALKAGSSAVGHFGSYTKTKIMGIFHMGTMHALSYVNRSYS